MLNNQLSRNIYIGTLSSVAFFLPLSIWLVSIFGLTLFFLWVFQGGWKKVAQRNSRGVCVFIFLGVYIVHLIWMINTSDVGSGLLQLREKLPFLLFPLAIGFSDPLNKGEMKTILSSFVAGVFISSIIGLVFYLINNKFSRIEDPRNISMFISHIRFALLINLAIILSIWYSFSANSKLLKGIYFTIVGWLTTFLFLLLSLTGILIFSIIIVIILFQLIYKSENRLLKIGFALLVSIFFVIAGVYLSNEIKGFYNKCKKYTYPLKEKTLNGNIYLHFPDSKDIENGNPVWIYLNEQELKKEWNLRSQIPYDSNDTRNQKLRYTLIRYLTSVGYTKDSVGMSQLRDQDIRYVESGITNRLFTEGKPLKSKVYETIWQIDYYRNGGNPSGHSVTQRIEFFKTGWHLMKKKFLFGTGTGDLKAEMAAQYEIDKSQLDPEYRLLPHNQFLNTLTKFGVIGFIIICLSLLLPIIRMRVGRNILFNLFLVISLMSMFGDDLLETHTGVCFFAYFYTLFVFGEVNNE
jgi:hypothetical protein